jgi:hypothetical protein
MSHFTVMVIGDNPEDQLKPYSENERVPRYVRYTKEQLIEQGRNEIESYKNSIYKRFLEDPEKYKEQECRRADHIEYLEKTFPKRINWTDEEVYQHEISKYSPEEIGSKGEVYSTYNPKSKWDWYSLGGRWSGSIKLKPGATGVRGEMGAFGNEVGIDQAFKKDIANFDELETFAILKDGEWFERGAMGWWGMVHDEKDENTWKNEFKKLVDGLPDDTLISIYDCHI